MSDEFKLWKIRNEDGSLCFHQVRPLGDDFAKALTEARKHVRPNRDYLLTTTNWDNGAWFWRHDGRQWLVARPWLIVPMEYDPETNKYRMILDCESPQIFCPRLGM